MPGHREVLLGRAGGLAIFRAGALTFVSPRRVQPNGVAVQRDAHHQPRLRGLRAEAVGGNGPAPWLAGDHSSSGGDENNARSWLNTRNFLSSGRLRPRGMSVCALSKMYLEQSIITELIATIIPRTRGSAHHLGRRVVNPLGSTRPQLRAKPINARICESVVIRGNTEARGSIGSTGVR